MKILKKPTFLLAGLAVIVGLLVGGLDTARMWLKITKLQQGATQVQDDAVDGVYELQGNTGHGIYTDNILVILTLDDGTSHLVVKLQTVRREGGHELFGIRSTGGSATTLNEGHFFKTKDVKRSVPLEPGNEDAFYQAFREFANSLPK